MPHPKKRKTKAARNQRRSHHALKEVTLTKCEKCGKPVKPHHACANCGTYKKKEVIDILKRLPRKERIKIEKKKKSTKDKEDKKTTKENEKKKTASK
ncbi:50S ribosomal protein L32 [Candidatus Parcubacteria bacterium]|nr:50S ribosomal protein L32 [Candidatus Parcubacteria bacterium]